MLVGASRQRAAPRCQFRGHGTGAPCKGQRRRGVLGLQVYRTNFVGPRHRVGGAMRFLNRRLFRTSTPPRKSVAQFKCGASNSFKISAPSNREQCWLTLRSTGHFAAHRRWASFYSRPTPVCRKMPVSSNVRRHTSRRRFASVASIQIKIDSGQ